MKKNVYLLIMVLFLSAQVFAQDNSQIPCPTFSQSSNPGLRHEVNTIFSSIGKFFEKAYDAVSKDVKKGLKDEYDDSSFQVVWDDDSTPAVVAKKYLYASKAISYHFSSKEVPITKDAVNQMISDGKINVPDLPSAEKFKSIGTGLKTGEIERTGSDADWKKWIYKVDTTENGFVVKRLATIPAGFDIMSEKIDTTTRTVTLADGTSKEIAIKYWSIVVLATLDSGDTVLLTDQVLLME